MVLASDDYWWTVDRGQALMWRDGSKIRVFVHEFFSARFRVGGCVTVVTVIYGIGWNRGRWNRELLFGPNVFVPIIRRCLHQS